MRRFIALVLCLNAHMILLRQYAQANELLELQMNMGINVTPGHNLTSAGPLPGEPAWSDTLSKAQVDETRSMTHSLFGVIGVQDSVHHVTQGSMNASADWDYQVFGNAQSLGYGTGSTYKFTIKPYFPGTLKLDLAYTFNSDAPSHLSGGMLVYTPTASFRDATKHHEEDFVACTPLEISGSFWGSGAAGAIYPSKGRNDGSLIWKLDQDQDIRSNLESQLKSFHPGDRSIRDPQNPGAIRAEFSFAPLCGEFPIDKAEKILGYQLNWEQRVIHTPASWRMEVWSGVEFDGNHRPLVDRDSNNVLRHCRFNGTGDPCDNGMNLDAPVVASGISTPFFDPLPVTQDGQRQSLLWHKPGSQGEGGIWWKPVSGEDQSNGYYSDNEIRNEAVVGYPEKLGFYDSPCQSVGAFGANEYIEFETYLVAVRNGVTTRVNGNSVRWKSNATSTYCLGGGAGVFQDGGIDFLPNTSAFVGILAAPENGEVFDIHEVTYPTGDVTFDGHVDLADLNAVRNNFGLANATGDADFDGIVGLNDLNAVRNNFGAISGATLVPEPSTLLLISEVTMVVCLAAMTLRRRRVQSAPGCR